MGEIKKYGLLAGPVLITVTTVSQTLNDLLVAAGSAIHVDLAHLTLLYNDVADTERVKWANGAAAVAAGGAVLPSRGIQQLRCDCGQAAALTLIVAATTCVLQVIQEGPEA